MNTKKTLKIVTIVAAAVAVLVSVFVTATHIKPADYIDEDIVD